MMMTRLGTAIVMAFIGQGWPLNMDDSAVVVTSVPTGRTILMEMGMFRDADREGELRQILLQLVVTAGLQWPWPPDHHEWIHGEIPRVD